MQLTDVEKKVLACVEIDAEISDVVAAKRCGLKVHTFRYALRKLISSQVIRGPMPFIDPWRSGFSPYVVRVSLVAKKSQSREKCIQYLLKSPKVCWIADVGGSFQFAIMLLVKRPGEITSLLQEVVEHSGATIARKTIAIRSFFAIFPRRYLSPVAHANKNILLSDRCSEVELDLHDRQILSACGQGAFQSEAKVAREVGISTAAVSRRMAKLKELGVVQRSLWVINLKLLQIQRYRIRLCVQSVKQSLSHLLFQFAEKHMHITAFSHYLGECDYEFSVEVYSNDELLALSAEINNEFGAFITSLELEPVFGYHKFSTYPAEVQKTAKF